MNSKIFLGVLLMLMGIFFITRQFVPDSFIRMFLNEQIILFLIGLYLGIVKKKTFGWLLAGAGVYLYVQEFYPEQFKITFPILIVLFGIILLIKGITEKKKKEIKSTKNNINTERTIIRNYQNDSDIEDATEIK